MDDVTYSEEYVGRFYTGDYLNPGTLVVKKETAEGQIFWIPRDEGNLDYQEYLVWLKENSKDAPVVE